MASLIAYIRQRDPQFEMEVKLLNINQKSVDLCILHKLCIQESLKHNTNLRVEIHEKTKRSTKNVGNQRLVSNANSFHVDERCQPEPAIVLSSPLGPKAYRIRSHRKKWLSNGMQSICSGTIQVSLIANWCRLYQCQLRKFPSSVTIKTSFCIWNVW